MSVLSALVSLDELGFGVTHHLKCNCRLACIRVRHLHMTPGLQSDFPSLRQTLDDTVSPPPTAGAAREGGKSAETPARLGEEAVQQRAGERRKGNPVNLQRGGSIRSASILCRRTRPAVTLFPPPDLKTHSYFYCLAAAGRASLCSNSPP